MEPLTPQLEGLEVVVTGRLASMTREHAIREIELRGGSYRERCTERTDVLVVGLEGWPLQRDGMLTHSLRRARELEATGHPIRILGEADFLHEIGLPERQEELRRLFTTEQLARILELPTGRLRSLVRKGLITPARTVRRLCYFDFAEVTRARALLTLLDQGVTIPSIRRSLEQLGRWLPDANGALSQLDLLERGGPLLFRFDDGQLAEPTGQLRFAFASEEAPVVSADRRPDVDAVPAPARSDARVSQHWFAIGVAAEDDGEWDTAADAYHRALVTGGPQAELCFNLGNVLHAAGRIGEAAQRYMMAAEIEPEYVEAWNNLGNAWAELGRLDDAAHVYRQALAIEPDYADAHFNLAETLQQAGDWRGAERHWHAYLTATPAAGDRTYVESMLDECRRHADSR